MKEPEACCWERRDLRPRPLPWMRVKPWGPSPGTGAGGSVEACRWPRIAVAQTVAAMSMITKPPMATG